MRGLIRLSVERPVAVIMALASLLLAAGFAATSLRLERLPSLALPNVVVETSYPGMAAEEIRSLLTIPLEDALNSVKGTTALRSVSRDGTASLSLDFAWGEDPAAAAGRVREAVDRVYPALPHGSERPAVHAREADAQSLLVVAVLPREGNLALARSLAEYELRSRLRRVEGVGRVSVTGGGREEVSVTVDLQRAAARGMTAADVAEILSAECVDVPAGVLAEGEREIVVSAVGKPRTAEALGSLALFGPSGAFRLSEIAETRKSEAPRESVFIAAGRECVGLEVFRRPGADPVGTAARSRRAVAAAGADFARDFELLVLYDSSAEIAAGVKQSLLSVIAGAVAAALALALFLRDARSSAIIASTIPFSVAAAVAVLGAAGKSLNGMSLGGLALGVGLISDNAVVVLGELSSRFTDAGRKPDSALVAEAVASVASSTFASALTTAVVFVPVIFLPGALGALFSDLALSLVAAVVAGWMLALFAVPSLYRLFWKSRSAVRRVSLESRYRRLLASAFRRPVAVCLAAACVSTVGAVLAFSGGLSYLPTSGVSELVVSHVFPSGTRLERIAERGVEFAAALKNTPGVAAVFGGAGAEGDDTIRRSDGRYRRERLSLRCILEIEDRDGIASALRQAILSLDPENSDVSVSPSEDPAATALGLNSGTVVTFKGADRAETSARAATFARKLKETAGNALRSETILPNERSFGVRLVPKREAAAHLGVSFARTAEILTLATNGGIVARLEQDGRGLDVRLRGATTEAPPAEVFALIPVSGAPILAGTVTEAEQSVCESEFHRENRADVVYLVAEAAPGGAVELERATDAILRDIAGAERSGSSAFSRHSSSIATTVALVLALLYAVLGAQFESFTVPLLLLVSVPFAAGGAGFALAAFGLGLAAGSILGIVVLFGTSVNNAILLFEACERRFEGGASAIAAAYFGASERVRPVLVTTLSTFFALAPVVAFPGGPAQKSMSTAMLGGFAASAILTVFVFPLLFAARGTSARASGAAR